MVTILVVDDDADVLESVSMLLELSFGHCARIVTACDGVQALEIAALFQPCLIVSDYAMPNMDGVTFVRRARRESALRDVPILILSGEPELAELTRGLDVQALVSKTDVTELATVARRLIRAGCGQAVA